MVKLTAIVGAMFLLPLAACNDSPSEKLADRFEKAADRRADTLEKQADALKNQAESIRKTGDQRSDAILAADRNVATMTQAQRDAIVANQAPAVK